MRLQGHYPMQSRQLHNQSQPIPLTRQRFSGTEPILLLPIPELETGVSHLYVGNLDRLLADNVPGFPKHIQTWDELLSHPFTDDPNHARQIAQVVLNRIRTQPKAELYQFPEQFNKPFEAVFKLYYKFPGLLFPQAVESLSLLGNIKKNDGFFHKAVMVLIKHADTPLFQRAHAPLIAFNLLQVAEHEPDKAAYYTGNACETLLNAQLDPQKYNARSLAPNRTHMEIDWETATEQDIFVWLGLQNTLALQAHDPRQK